ncbi:MAG: class II glutamine amidotransferase [Planctomycetaceae bacterium]
MCRWLAYSGPPVLMSTLLTRPDHSLIDQSRHARENIVTTNGDGFGVGWYGNAEKPGCYHETHPAWNDLNLKHLAAHISSRLFLAHVRAATGTPVQQSNCHPFAFEDWLFQHNGMVPEFSKIKRRLLFNVAPDLFPHIRGSTDSEALFFLALTFGLKDDPQSAIERTVGHVECVRKEAGIQQPFTFSAAMSDGTRLYGVRYSSDANSPSLYHGQHLHALQELHDTYEPLPSGAVVVVSEPLDEVSNHWTRVPESTFLMIENGKLTHLPLVPTAA